MQQTESDGDRESQNRKRLREELRLRFPEEQGYEVCEGEQLRIFDGSAKWIPVTTVTGNGIEIFFSSFTPSRATR